MDSAFDVEIHIKVEKIINKLHLPHNKFIEYYEEFNEQK
jgi:hypothetical protein